MNKKMVTNVLYLVVIGVLALLFAYNKGWIFADFESISPKEAKELLERDKSVALIDVRTKEEYANGHLIGSIHISVSELSENLKELDEFRGKKIVVYCQSGNRSVYASRLLQKNGFIPLNMSGGISKWESEGLPISR